MWKHWRQATSVMRGKSIGHDRSRVAASTHVSVCIGRDLAEISAVAPEIRDQSQRARRTALTKYIESVWPGKQSVRVYTPR